MPTLAEHNRQADAAYKEAAPHEHWIDEVKDGRHVLIRPLTAADREREYDFIKNLSPESRHARFLGEINEPGKRLMDQLMNVDNQHRMAFIALVHDNGKLIEIGVARYAEAKEHECECAVTVAEDWRQRGLGVLLMRHLIDLARRNGYKQMISIDAADNEGMRDLASYLGFHRRPDPSDSSQVTHTLDL